MATITEDYVSFEIAKLLEEKGFDSICNGYYNQEKVLERVSLCSVKDTFKSPFYFDCVPAPTLQMAMKWLREVYKIHIQIWILEEKGYWFNIEKILNAQYKHKSLYSSGLEDIYFETYEQAAESAIKYWLKNKEYI